MTIRVQKIALREQPQHNEGKPIHDNYLGLIDNVEVACTVRLGSLALTIGELRKLQEGQTLTLEQKTHEPVDIVLNNQVIARGDIMSCDEHFAIQITEIFS